MAYRSQGPITGAECSLVRHLTVSLITSLMVFGAASAEAAGPPSRLTPPEATMPITSTTSLLVVSPHPGAEVLCCYGVIQRVLHAGGRVSVVWLTSGGGNELDLLVV